MDHCIIRVHRRTDYTVLSNHAIKNKELSYRACGILWHLLSKPDGWSFNSAEIFNSHTEGRDAIRSALAELKEHGYLSVGRTNREDGSLAWMWKVYEVPEEVNRSTENQELVNVHRNTGNQELVNHVLETRTYSNTETSNNEKYKKEYKIDPKVEAIFEYWSSKRAKAIGLSAGPKMKLTQARAAKVAARLAEGYTEEQLREAIDGCLSNDYNVTNGYTDIELIMRNQGKVEQYRSWSKAHTKSSVAASSSLYEEYVPL
jgi:hypothetical protein